MSDDMLEKNKGGEPFIHDGGVEGFSEHELKRGLKNRHAQMISCAAHFYLFVDFAVDGVHALSCRIGGVIGTGVLCSRMSRCFSTRLSCSQVFSWALLRLWLLEGPLVFCWGI
jgi:hypothetical protein